MKNYILILFLMTLGLILNAQHVVVFDSDRFIPINNPLQNSFQFSVLIKVQSLSTNKDANTYECFFSSTNRRVELADHMGKLAFYDGKKWQTSELDIRSSRKNITLTFKNGVYKVFNNKTPVFIGGSIYDNPYFQSKAFYIGSSYTAESFFNGVIDQVAFYSTILTEQDLGTLETSPNYINFIPHPLITIDFRIGMVLFNGFSDNQIQIQEDIGQIQNQDKRSPINYPHYDELIGARDLREKKQINLGTKRHYLISIDKELADDLGFEGLILGKPNLLYQGEYNLTISEDGKVKITRTIVTDKN